MKKRRERKAGKGGRETAVSGRNGRHSSGAVEHYITRGMQSMAASPRWWRRRWCVLAAAGGGAAVVVAELHRPHLSSSISSIILNHPQFSSIILNYPQLSSFILILPHSSSFFILFEKNYFSER